MTTSFLAEIAAVAHSPADEPTLRAEFTHLVQEDPARILREGGPVHLTASAVVVDASGEYTALLWHRKGRFWVQPGGHLEAGETSFEQAARREVREELGLANLERVGKGPATLHQHELSAGFGRCRAHWDVQFVLRTPEVAARTPLRGNAESDQVLWARIDQLPEGVVADLPPKLQRLSPLLTPRVPGRA